MDYSFDKDFATIVLIAAAVGAFGGLVWDIANPIRRFSKNPPVGLDNRLVFPKLFKGSGGTSGLDLGFLGPLIIGAAAGAVAVLVAARSAPDSAEVVKQLSNLATKPASDQTAKAAQDALGQGVDKPALCIVAFLGGIAGWALLQTLASRLSSLFEVAVTQTAQASQAAAASAIEKAAQEQDLTSEQTQPIVEAARQAVADAVTPPASGG